MISSFARSAAALAAALLLSVVAVPEASAGGPFCGDQTCSIGEDCSTCPQDCPGCCSNGATEDGEGCDDGDLTNGDGCNSDCFVEDGSSCGEAGPGLVGDQSCASGVCDETQSAEGVCEAANVCGNGTLEAGEGCDDGGDTSLDGCNSSCLVENESSCNADGAGLTGSESCASGLCDATEGVNGACEALATCGNGALEAAEGCDDGDVSTGDGCNENCLIEDPFSCNADENGMIGDDSCASGICDETEGPNGTCQALNDCGNTVCEVSNEETCLNCEVDCLVCPSTTITTTTSTTTSTTTLTSTTTSMEPPTTTTTMEPTTTTTSTTSTSTSTMPVTGACCVFGSCQTVAQDYCIAELQGVYAGDDTTCDDPGVCSDCGNGCIEFSETCDDGDTQNGDGCNNECEEEECWSCFAGASLTGDSIPTVACPGGGPSICEEEELCTICGDGITEGDEQCDPGKEPDPCCDDCEFVAAQTSCSNGTFCDGAETCDGSGNCNDQPDPTCDQLDSACAEGYCDPQLDACASETASKDGQPCQATGDCVAAGGGTCDDGTCVGAASLLSPTCRWIIVGGTPVDDVRVRTGPGSTVDADMCGDTARIAGITTDDIVAIAPTGEGIRFYGPPIVEGDIVTGGSTVRASLYLDIPGTFLKTVDTGMTEPKLPAGVVSTTGTHPLVEVCGDDQGLLVDAEAALEVMPSDATEGLKIAIGSAFTIDVTGQGITVVDMAQLKVSHGATLTLKGNASDVIVLRVNGGRLKFGYGARLTLDGLVPENVLIYSDGSRCRVSPGVVGAGTLFCPNTGRMIVGAGVNWSGTFLGASRELRVRSNADLVHVPFTGF